MQRDALLTRTDNNLSLVLLYLFVFFLVRFVFFRSQTKPCETLRLGAPRLQAWASCLELCCLADDDDDDDPGDDDDVDGGAGAECIFSPSAVGRVGGWADAWMDGDKTAGPMALFSCVVRWEFCCLCVELKHQRGKSACLFT